MKELVFALFPNIHKAQSKNLVHGIKDYLNAHGGKVLVPAELSEELQIDSFDSVKESEINFRVSIGGDGTILHLVHSYPSIRAPLLCINMGSLGFMADIPSSEVYPCLQDVLNGHYTLERRIMMEGETALKDRGFALNEFVIHRSKNPSLIELAIHVDGSYLNTFTADGIIISTPSGSTAYSLAAGGPILSPELEAFVLTPISPHTISNRPIVFMPSHEVKIQYLSSREPIEVYSDGIESFALKTGHVFTISKSERVCYMVRLNRHDYYSTLRSKLGWSGKIRSPSS